MNNPTIEILGTLAGIFTFIAVMVILFIFLPYKKGRFNSHLLDWITLIVSLAIAVLSLLMVSNFVELSRVNITILITMCVSGLGVCIWDIVLTIKKRK